jgi:hypothetical protein
MSNLTLPRRNKSVVTTVLIAIAFFIGLFVIFRWRRSA